ncbi:MAG: sulfotransferase [Acidobacteriota bacterium]
MSGEARRFRAYCVGLPKAGTHSLAGIFQPTYRSLHEPERIELVEHFVGHVRKQVSDEQLLSYLRARDERLGLEMDASVYNYLVLPQLLELFPEARFIVLVRDCLSWVESAMRHSLGNISTPYEMSFWRAWLRVRRYRHEPEEKVLEDLKLFPLRSYLEGWSRFLRHVHQLVPEGQLLAVKTLEIAPSSGDLAAFLDIPQDTLNLENSHLFKAQVKERVLEKLDQDFVLALAQETCGSVMDHYFPGEPIAGFFGTPS